MAITYYMLLIPSVLFFLIITVLFAGLAGLATYFFRKYIKIRILRSHNEVTGFLFVAVSGFYALLLSFIILVVWNEYNETNANVAREGSFAQDLYRDIKYYPDTADSKMLMKVYLQFIGNVINDEFPKMASLSPSRQTPESFNRVFDRMEHLNPKSDFQIQLVSEMFGHLNQLATYRGLRINSVNNEIPASFWLPILVGAMLTITSMMLLDIEHLRMHVFLTSLLGAIIAIFFFLIIMLDHPFTGTHGIRPASYKQVLILEKWDRENSLHALKVKL